ncbi:MAG: RelA/SpoT family protein [Candidatus Komeilibacteria bacterium]
MSVISWEDLRALLLRNYPDDDLHDVARAYEFARQAHIGQKRKTGEDYIHHSLATAYNLALLHMDLPTIIAGILHDVPEDTTLSLAEVRQEFGNEVATLVAGITKLGTLKYRGIERYAENLRKMFVAMAQDLRIIIIKLADRLHNVQSLDTHRPEKALRIAKETMEIYAPIANRLGMFELKSQLEDYSFPYVYPEEYAWVQSLVQDRLKSDRKFIDKVQKIIYRELVKNHIPIVEIHGRVKHLYSLYKKLMAHGRDINKVYDLVAIRIIVPTVADCYSVLGVIHGRWTPLKGRVKDYIAQPKPNGYQSLHTSVFTDNGKVIEFQIRDQVMHEIAEYGIAAHSKYKETKHQFYSKKSLQWINELIAWQKSIKDNIQYVKEIKNDIFQDRIFVFTPDGDVIDLPEEATPIDFAYHIHSELGQHTTGVLINQQISTLDHALKSGDVIEIITDKNRKRPSDDWLKIARTATAREKIRNQLRRTHIGKIWT